MNLNSLRAKRDELALALAEQEATFALLQETKLSSTSRVEDLALKDYNILRRDRTSHGGGIAILSHRSADAHIIRSCPRSEILSASLLIRRARVTLVCAYRPPGLNSRQSEDFLSDLSDILAEIPHQNPAVFGGDVNLHLGSAESAALESLLEGNNFKVMNNAAVATHEERCIDWVGWRGEGESFDGPFDFPPLEKKASGHRLQSFCLVLWPFTAAEPSALPRLDWKRWDREKAKLLCLYSEHSAQLFLRPIESRVDTSRGPSLQYESLCSELHIIIQQTVPKLKVRSNGFREPEWMTDEIRILSKRQRFLFRSWKASGDCTFLKAANKAKRKKRRLIAVAKRNWAHRIITRSRREKRLWDIYKRLSNEKRPAVATFLIDNHVVSSDAGKAECLAETFSTNYVRGHSSPDKSPDTTVPPPPPPESLVTAEQASQLLHTLKPNKATGGDGVPARLLRGLSDEIGPALANLINNTLLTRRVPQSWRQATVTPVPKKSNPLKPSDYRPISILDQMSKLWERHIEHLLEDFSWTSNQQFGFKKMASTGDALLQAQRTVLQLSSAQKKVQISLMSLDLCKAFDRVPTDRILESLRERKVPTYLLDTLRSWLCDRSFRVKVGDEVSSWRAAPSGIPQGSRLGPRLFSITFDSVLRLQLPPNISVQAYADDLLIIGPRSSEDEHMKFQLAAEMIASHLQQLGMELNIAKTQLLNVHLRPSHFAPLSLNGEEVTPSKTLRYLGVVVDEALSFATHWEETSASAKRLLGAVGRLCHRDPPTLLHLYRERVASYLQYSLPFTPPTTQTSWARLNGVASHLAHLITNTWHVAGQPIHGFDIIAMAGIESLSALYLRRTLMYTSRALDGLAAFYPERSTEPLRRDGLRSAAVKKPDRELAVTPCRERLSRLQPRRMAVLWNLCLSLETSGDVNEILTALCSLQPDIAHSLLGIPKA